MGFITSLFPAIPPGKKQQLKMNTNMKEITGAELQGITGGVFPVAVAVGSALLGAAAGSIINGWSDFKGGFQAAYWHQQKLAD